jgi:hypothetical protein
MRLRTQLRLIVGIAVASCAAGTPEAFAQATPRKGATGPAVKRAAPADNRPEAVDAREREAKLEKLLAAWETQSSRLKTLDVQLEHQHEQPDDQKQPAHERVG